MAKKQTRRSVSIRGTTYDNEDRDFADSVGVRVIAIEEFHKRGVEDVMTEAKEIVGNKKTYVSYDIDFVDPAFAPGTGYIEPGGLSSREIIYMIKRLALLKNFRGADIVEINPDKDINGMTVKLGAKLLSEML